MGEIKGVCVVLMGKPEGNRPPVRPRRRQKDNIKMYLQEVEWGHRLHWIGSGWEQVAGSYKSGNEPSGSIKCGEFLG